jgi:hypothetical protein
VVQDGKLINPAGGRGTWGATTGPRLLSFSRLTSGRASTTVMEPVAPAYSQPLPPLPPGVGGPDGRCGAGGCAPAGHGRARDGFCWDRLKAWLCYAPSKSDLPKCKPTPYITPLQGMFPCVPGAYGCGACANGQYGPNGHYPAGQPLPPPMPQPGAQPPPNPMPLPAGTSAGAVLMPQRAAQAAPPAPTYQGKATPAAVSARIPGYRFASPESRSLTRPFALPPVENTSAKVSEK